MRHLFALGVYDIVALREQQPLCHNIGLVKQLSVLHRQPFSLSEPLWDVYRLAERDGLAI